MIRNSTIGLFLAVTLALGACGSKSEPVSPSPPSPPAEGNLLQDPPTQQGVFTSADVYARLGLSPFAAEVAALAFSPICTVSIYHMEYETVGGKGEAATASGALMIPSGTQGSCQGPFPIVVYAHGTSTDKRFNIADITASRSAEGLLMAAVFASQGYLVVAPNYAGYDTSDLPYHPYLNAAQQSQDMIDSLTAARQAMASLGASASGKVFITGYSQGGFVAMATHRAMQAAGMTVTASAPMSGPYALAAFADAVFAGQVNNSGPVNLVLITNSYQHSYGNLYSQPGDMFEAAYADSIDGLLPAPEPLNLPSPALFSSTPPAPEYASITPATQPAALASVFAGGFGSDNLVTNEFRLAYLQDAAAHPDGGFPTLTTGIPAAAPATGLRQDFARNDLRDWTPTAPVLLCGGANDPTVFYFDTELMQAYWAKNAPGASVTVLDVDSPATDPYSREKTGFAAVKQVLQLESGSAAVLSAYHATLVPPFCLSAVKQFFDSH